jgi:hypothetical protein
MKYLLIDYQNIAMRKGYYNSEEALKYINTFLNSIGHVNGLRGEENFFDKIDVVFGYNYKNRKSAQVSRMNVERKKNIEALRKQLCSFCSVVNILEVKCDNYSGLDDRLLLLRALAALGRESVSVHIMSKDNYITELRSIEQEQNPGRTIQLCYMENHSLKMCSYKPLELALDLKMKFNSCVFYHDKCNPHIPAKSISFMEAFPVQN